MSRGLDRDESRPSTTAGTTGPTGRGDEARHRGAPGDGRSTPRARGHAQPESRQPRPLPSGRNPARLRDDGRSFAVRGAQSRVLQTLATFRVVFERDLSMGEYRNHRWQMARDLRALDRQGLVDRKEVAADRTGRHLRAVTLTPAGRALIERHPGPSRFSQDGNRPVHAGWGKPRELAHDASLYRMYLAEEPRILNEGGMIRAVLLDDDLKHRIYEQLDEWRGDTGDDNRRRLLELAHAEDIPVIDDHLQFPDLRVEYDTPSGARTKVDLELTTDHYRGGQLAAKRQAGFTLYGAHGRSLAATGKGGSPVSVDPDFLSGLLSL